MSNWHETTTEKVLKDFSVNAETGLSHSEIETNLQKYDKNMFVKPPKERIITMVIHQFRDVANVILLFAGFLSLALAIREGHGYIEPVVIFAIIFMNVALAVSQERSASKALEALQNLNSPTCIVLRNGVREEIDTINVVPGDILLLKTGDLIAADARLIESVNFYVDESALTGESEAVEKDASITVDAEAPIGDRINMVFSGCLITAGNATAVVTETGMNTQMGKIAKHLNNTQKIQTPLQKRLNKVSRMVSIIAVVSAIVLLALGLRQGEDFWVMMLAAVSLAVAAVPETLQLIVTLTLTQGVKHMVTKNALTRKLAAVETLGNTSIICSDKTGTLTQNRMTIQELWTPSEDVFSPENSFTDKQKLFLQHLVMASNATIERDNDGTERIIGDATESAIIRLSMAQGINRDDFAQWSRVGEIAFSSARKMMTIIYKCPEGGYLILTKGAFDRLPYADVSEQEKELHKKTHNNFANEALRVIALGSRKISELPADGNLESLETDLEFEGLIGLLDPPRKEAKTAVAAAKNAGIRTIMITGDHAATAKAIAKKIGILESGEKVVTGQQLTHMEDEELIENVRSYSVYARVSPEDKIRIVEAWQENGEVVAMTGDGVNDAPALKAADVGVAMGVTGTEVAKSASDIVLTDDNFATIVSAVQQGRNVFGNIRKTLYFLLVCNLSEIVIMIGAYIMGWGLPLTPVMLLLINVLADGIPGLRLAHEQNDPRIMSRKPIGREESFLGGGLMVVILQQTVAFSVVGLAAYYCGAFLYAPSAELAHITGQTMTFLVVSFTSIIHIFTVRSRKSIFKTSLRHNMPLLYSVIGVLILFASMAVLPPLQFIFELTSISPQLWLIVFGFTLVPTIIAELFKLWRHHVEEHEHFRRVIHHYENSDI